MIDARKLADDLEKASSDIDISAYNAAKYRIGLVVADLRQSPTEPDDTAWLIELSEPDGPRYFQFEFDDDWTKDHDSAVHFSRRQDAEKAIEHYGWTRANAVEHCWPWVRSVTPPDRTGS